jgi:ferredoxin-NADP reductase/MOSC domain-containing protein YiiM
VPRLLSVNVGRPRDVEWAGRTVRTAIWKEPVHGRRMVRRINIEGDEQADRQGHGGEHRAVFVYQIEAYTYWQEQLGRSDFAWGQFGENFTVEGLADSEVCIGDQYRIGNAVFEVTQPRVTCYRLGIRMREPRMPALVVAHHRPGFYLRVLEEGDVGAGDTIKLVARGPQRMTVAEVDALLYLPGHSPQQLERVLRIPALSPGWRASFQALLDQAGTDGATGNAGLASPTARPAWSGFRPLRIVAIHEESQNVVSLVLESADGGPLARPLAGQFVSVRLPPRDDRAPVIRSYSLSAAPSAAQYRISIKLEPGGAASTYIRTRARVGEVVEVAAPRGSFCLLPGTGPVVLASAGVGITPVLAMLHGLAEEGPGREVWWLHGARNSLEHPFVEEVRTLLSRLPHARSQVWYSRPAPHDRLGRDFDAHGRLTADALDHLGVPVSADYYLCGPGGFLRDLQQGLFARHVPAAQVHTETFGPEASITPGLIGAARRQPHAPAELVGTGPLVSFARSGLHVRWAPAFRSVLDLAEACDVATRWSCRSGVCHTCETRLLEGQVAYAPDPLEAPAAGHILTCCAQPTTDLVLDL